jgi:hypothetical protein
MVPPLLAMLRDFAKRRGEVTLAVWVLDALWMLIAFGVLVYVLVTS